MKTYLICSNQSKEIELKVDGERFALVHRARHSLLDGSHKATETIVMNKREVLNLYEAIKEEVWREFNK